MSPEAINKAVAEACGWKIIPERPNPGHARNPENPPTLREQYVNPEGRIYFLPDFCNDLNAIHEAEKILLQDHGEWERYFFFLDRVCDFPNQIFNPHATAAQRAEAFLRTIGKWQPAQEKGEG